jgi:hypothetical protein
MIPALFLLTGLLSWAQADDRILSVDLRDVAQHGATELPEAAILLQAMSSTPNQFFPTGVRFALEGVGLPRRSVVCQVNRRGWTAKSLTNAVYGVELRERPVYNADGSTDLALVALIHSEGQGHFFRKFDVRVGGNPRSVIATRVLDDIPASRTRFSLQIGLLPRKAVLTDETTGIRKIYPLGVGGFDEGIKYRGKVSLLTPLYQGATLDRNRVMRARSDHSYYCGMPFLRMSRKDGSYSPIGIHIIQHPQMIRGFDSHGCVRMREKDLYEVYALLMTQETPKIPLNVNLRIEERAEHPYPIRDNGYQSVVDCANPRVKPDTCYEGEGTPARPRRARASRSCKDKDGLTLTRDYACRPPVENLAEVPPEHAELLDDHEHEPGEEGEPDLGEDLLPEFLRDELSGREGRG